MQAKKPGWTALPFHLPPVLLEEEEEGHEAGRDPIEALGEALNEAEGSVEGGEGSWAGRITQPQSPDLQ